MSRSISLWSTGKKKPIFTKPLTHGVDELLPDSDHSMPGARWITSLASVRGTDLFASGRSFRPLVINSSCKSGSWDGSIRLWALDPGLRSFSPASTHSIPVAGVVNALQILSLSATSVDSTTWQSSPKEIPAPIVPDEDTEPAPPTRARREILLVAAVGQEPRLGRWMRIKDGVRNGAAIAHLQLDETGQAMIA